MSKSTSVRIKEIASRRVVDDAARQRRARKALESLEQDNNCEDPHADLVMSKKALSLFQDDDDAHAQRKNSKRKARTTEYYKQRFRKNLSQLLEEEAAEQEGEVSPGQNH
jgi:zinc finger HIT domain-containing protein 1